MQEVFTLEDLATMTMLSTRTLRNYISQGYLCGKKLDGVWKFTSEDLDKFYKEDFIKQTIQSKNNGIIYDYIANDTKNEDSVCSIYDYPNLGHKEAESICNRMKQLVNSNQYGKVKFSYNYNAKKKLVRIILTGTIIGIHALIHDFIPLSSSIIS